MLFRVSLPLFQPPPLSPSLPLFAADYCSCSPLSASNPHFLFLPQSTHFLHRVSLPFLSHFQTLAQTFLRGFSSHRPQYLQTLWPGPCMSLPTRSLHTPWPLSDPPALCPLQPRPANLPPALFPCQSSFFGPSAPRSEVWPLGFALMPACWGSGSTQLADLFDLFLPLLFVKL